MAKLAELRAKVKGSRPRVERRSKSRPVVEGFWDRPPLMNLMADLLFLLGGVALTYAVVMAFARLPWFPLNQVVVTSPLVQVTSAQIEYAAKSSLTGNFFTVNVEGVRTAFEKLPWVRSASVRRHWPDGIEVAIEEHVAVARWQSKSGETRLVNDRGEVFAAALPGSQTLPLFGGPEGSAPLVLERYREFSGMLEPLGRALRVVDLSPRQAWQLRLDDGLMLELGRDQMNLTTHERLQRFVGIYEAAKARFPRAIAAIDMRYPNGFALRPGHGEAAGGANKASPANSGKGTT